MIEIMLMKLNEFPAKAIFEKAPEFPSTFFFKTVRIQNKGWFWVLKTLGEQNTGRSLPIATLWLLFRRLTKIFEFSDGNNLSDILWLVLNLLCVQRYYWSWFINSLLQSEFFKRSNDSFSKWPKANILNWGLLPSGGNQLSEAFHGSVQGLNTMG